MILRYLAILLVLLSCGGLGTAAFLFLFGTAWSGQLADLLVALLLASASSVLVSFLAALFWPRFFVLWGLAYAAPTLCFSGAAVHEETPWAFLQWFGIGALIFLAGAGGGYLGKLFASQRARTSGRVVSGL